MPDITFTITAAHTTRLVDALAGLHQYQEEIDGEANPESKAEFARRLLGEWATAQVKRWEKSNAAKEAADAVDTEINVTVA